jgi:hypothetical protein
VTEDRAPRTAALWRRWLPAAFDRVPTGWLAGILTALFLGVTAGFGGLSAAAAPPIATLDAGETHESAQFAVTVERAVLIDSLPEAGIRVPAWQRVLAVVVTVENRWDRPLPSTGSGGLEDVVRVAALGDVGPAAIARFDDTGENPTLQPRVPAQLVLTWAVGGGQVRDGDTLDVELRDLSLYRGTFVLQGESWSDPVLAARVAVPATDVGAGVDAAAGDGAGG